MENQTGSGRPALPPAQGEPADGGLEAVSAAIESLDKKEEVLTAVSAPNVSSVAPGILYAGISEITLTPEAVSVLEGAREAEADEVEIRPDGFIYTSHEYARRALLQAFGPGGWAMRPISPIVFDKNPQFDTIAVHQRWALFIHGRYAGEAIGGINYWANNKGGDKSDVAEGVKSEALRRICKDLGIGLNLWNRRFQREWRTKYAVRVRVKNFDGRVVERWRRKDEPPLEGEIQAQPTPVSTLGRVEYAKRLDAQGTSAPAPIVQSIFVPPAAPGAIPRTAELRVNHLVPQTNAAQPGLTERQFALFMKLARDKGLIKGNEGGAALAWLCETLNVLPPKPGRMAIEALRDVLEAATPAQFQDVIKELRQRPSAG